jgi:hypothetical protein
MKALLAAVALAGLMEEANDGTTGSAGGAAAGEPAQDAQAPNVDTSVDSAQDAPAATTVEGAVDVQPDPEKAEDEFANALAAGNPKVALIAKYGDRVPVQLKNQAHLDSLRAEHGEAAVKVVS